MEREVKRILLVFFVAACVWCGPAAADDSVQQRVTSGQVTAEFTYRRTDGVVRDARLTITRAGRTLVDVDLTRVGCSDCPTWRPAGRFVVRSLDGDAEPEVLVDLYTGGAHCCTYSLIYRYVPESGSYARQTQWWGNVGYRLIDLDRAGAPEFVSSDDRFASAFTGYAASANPIRLWRYDAGRMLDVTRRFPREIERDARQLWRLYLKERRRDVRGILAAWLADQMMLGRVTEGWRALETARRRGELGPDKVEFGEAFGRRYFAKLRSFLRRTGYLR
jgi:hypothetical protein